MITDTCRCGARFTVQYNHASCEQKAHRDWLASHSVCRHTGTVKVGEMESSTILGQVTR